MSAAKPTTDCRIAFLSAGQIQILQPDGTVQQVQSRFGESVRQRAVEIEQRHAWKTQGRGAQFASGGLLWGVTGAAQYTRVAVTSIARGRETDELLYTLDTSDVGGLFAVQTSAADSDEQRLFHSNQQRIEFPCAATTQDRLLCAVRHDSGTANLATMQRDGSELRLITEGDSLDLAPSWLPGEVPALLFQSAGIGRDEQGAPIGLGPYEIKRLTLSQGRLEDFYAETGQDLLGPRLDSEGNLLAIRRPYVTPDHGGSPWRAVLDFLLFPVRLVFALFAWLNFFTARYTGKPLTTAGGPQKQGADMQQMMVWGNLIDANKAAKRRGAEADAPDLVPTSWQLLRRRPDGQLDLLARGVLAFDLDGADVIYTNGSAIFRLSSSGERVRLHRGEQITHLAVLRAT